MSEFHKDRLNEKINEFKLSSNKDEKPYKEVISQLFNMNENINAKTQVSHDEVYNLARLSFYQQLTGSELLNGFIKEFKELRVSLDRKGRQEIIDIFSSDIKVIPEEQEKKRFFGLW
jgi:hypothetical protein